MNGYLINVLLTIVGLLAGFGISQVLVVSKVNISCFRIEQLEKTITGLVMTINNLINQNTVLIGELKRNPRE